MKLLRKSVVILMAVLLLVLTLPTVFAAEDDSEAVFTEVNETVYATGNVNIRTGPGTSYKRINTLSRGEAIQRIAIGDNGWSKVEYKGETAYVFSEYLSTARPIVTVPDVDYSKLTLDIAIANGLKKIEYTMESWDVLSDALSRATSALNSKSQATVDECEKALEDAVAGLVKLDRSALEEALTAADAFTGSNEANALWIQLSEALSNGQALMNGNDQAAIDAAADQINELLAEVRAQVNAQDTPQIITQEVMVEVPPTDDYCNISGHRVWPVLFFCSLAINVALVALIVVYVSQKKKNQKDDTPLVDYDINDDLF